MGPSRQKPHTSLVFRVGARFYPGIDDWGLHIVDPQARGMLRSDNKFVITCFRGHH